MCVWGGGVTSTVCKCGVEGEARGGGGVIGLEKGTDCGPTAVERWLSRPKMAKKRGLRGRVGGSNFQRVAGVLNGFRPTDEQNAIFRYEHPSNNFTL